MGNRGFSEISEKILNSLISLNSLMSLNALNPYPPLIIYLFNQKSATFSLSLRRYGSKNGRKYVAFGRANGGACGAVGG